MSDYTIKMSGSLRMVPVGKLTEICKFLGGTYDGVEGDTFKLKNASRKPNLKAVNTAFAKENLVMTCRSITDEEDNSDA